MKTIRVRIAVVVNADGEYRSYSSKNDVDAEDTARLFACEDSLGDCHLHWIEATVPLPEPVTVEGKVTT